MNGPEHYKEAERLAAGIHERMRAIAKDIAAGNMNLPDGAAVSNALIATAGLAQVHATLAVASAVDERYGIQGFK